MPLVAVLREHPHNQAIHNRGTIRQQCVDRIRWLVHVLVHDAHEVRPFKDRAPRHHVVKRATETVDVRARIDVPLAVRLLRTDEMRRAHDKPGDRLARDAFAQNLRQPEITQLHHAVLRQEDVVRFDVAVNQLRGLPGVIERHGDVIRNVQRFGQGKAPTTPQPLLDCFAFHEFHGDVFDAAEFTRRVNVNDVRMVEIGRGNRFRLKPRDMVLLRREVRRKNLQRHHALQ